MLLALTLCTIEAYFHPIGERANAKIWTDADFHVWKGTLFRHGGFTAHPKYLEAAEKLGITDVWEQRGPPDFCNKVADQWICE